MNKTRKDYFWTDYRNNNFIKIKEKKKLISKLLNSFKNNQEEKDDEEGKIEK